MNKNTEREVTVTQEALKPCPNPWCASNESPFAWKHPHGFHAVSCAACEVSAPNKPTRAEAIEAWNTRALETELAALREERDKLLAEIKRRDANETRNCINWGPCSKNDGDMGEKP